MHGSFVVERVEQGTFVRFAILFRPTKGLSLLVSFEFVSLERDPSYLGICISPL
jgi:hypothetical protein